MHWSLLTLSALIAYAYAGKNTMKPDRDTELEPDRDTQLESDRDIEFEPKDYDSSLSNEEFLRKKIVNKSKNKSVSKSKPKPKPKPIYKISNLLPSIRLAPDELHLCTGTFITHKTIITTARCLYGRPVHRMFVYSHVYHLDRAKGIITGVRSTILHPHFELSPRRSDIGLVKLKKSVKRAAVFHLPFFSIGDVPRSARAFGWKFDHHREKYYQYQRFVKIVPRPKCSLLLNEYINCDTVCARGFYMEKGSYDEGTPLAVRFHNKTSHHKFYIIVGVYDIEGVRRRNLAEKYQLVLPHNRWIRRHMYH